jgi:ascorbate-specific PTS system EIIC-type component UlaA
VYSTSVRLVCVPGGCGLRMSVVVVVVVANVANVANVGGCVPHALCASVAWGIQRGRMYWGPCVVAVGWWL